MAKQKTYIFEISGGFSIDGKGSTPRQAFEDAKKELNKIQTESKELMMNEFKDKHLTGRYNIYGKDDIVETGVFPYRI
jgi:hypothetical protein